MNDLGDANLRTRMLDWTALLAADAPDQLAWLGEREVDTEDVIDEVELFCRVAEELTERGAFEPGSLRELQDISRRLGQLDAACRAGLWADALATDPAWEDIRALARRFLLGTLGDGPWPLPPRRAHPPTDGH
ncbi:hypothetical protein [Streptomyces palmae]|uniref:Uncharacterized protein n=1 Tax=Streptomyces palmae TaxID=1701085 RepID=A0A4Z0FMF3_9ACTN|nr:hypothetical protein [Streptomyces palmae]TGA84052.1 hypothetical protein E4099_31635 [Streptomyces palmae]